MRLAVNKRLLNNNHVRLTTRLYGIVECPSNTGSIADTVFSYIVVLVVVD